jgi:hypothetical protein
MLVSMISFAFSIDFPKFVLQGQLHIKTQGGLELVPFSCTRIQLHNQIANLLMSTLCTIMRMGSTLHMHP